MPAHELASFTLDRDDGTYQAFKNALPTGRTTRLNLPDMIPCNLIKLQPPAQLIRSHRIWQILLIRKHKQQRILHLPVLNDARKFSASLFQTIAVAAVYDKHQALSTAEVVSPQRSDLILSTNVPDIEFGVLVRNGLHVEANCRDGSHVLLELEVVQDSCCARDTLAMRLSVGCMETCSIGIDCIARFKEKVCRVAIGGGVD